MSGWKTDPFFFYINPGFSIKLINYRPTYTWVIPAHFNPYEWLFSFFVFFQNTDVKCILPQCNIKTRNISSSCWLCFWNTDVTIWCLVFLPTSTKNRITEKLELNKPSPRIQQRSKPPVQRILLLEENIDFTFLLIFCSHKLLNVLTVKATE